MSRSVEPTREQARAWSTQAIEPIELLHATYVTHTFPRHSHEEFCIGVVTRGAETVLYRGTTHFAPAGSLIVINPGEVHANHAADARGWTYRIFYPQPRLMQQVASEIAGRTQNVPFFLEPVLQDPRLFQAVLQLHIALEQSNSALERESCLVLGLAQLVKHHADSRCAEQALGQENRAVQQIRDYLETHYPENVSLAQLARIAELSPFYLTRVFSRAVGLPPHAYLTQVRVTRAKSLLSLGWSILEVAAETGFADQSHLTRQFKRLVGVTPGQYQLGSKNLQDKL
ncbi:AraC family transcriptional regulator [Leptolyngbya sp. FACHB-261]|uniref:AraC family transcriptional regulator n=1 Tax=Leptolyngbya sp. FACHB-261 TaxID=2692806 RepID=UPI001681D466|nr:AraC family transcriptional regulator [Leptolyngbya sp. FACHB-261]MBD2104440.1 AraC family transcriptional regulator [Leptolyngbya sp. FACHB-261]